MPIARRLLLIASACATLLALPGVHAAKEDQYKGLTLVFDREGEVDRVKQRAEFNGNVILTKGTLEVRAERLDLRESADGYYQAYASGAATKQVAFRQARDTPGERIEGRADQVEYDTRTETVRLVGNAEARVMQGDQLKQLVSGATLNYDSRTERFGIEPGANAPHPGGRGRVVLMPRAPAPVEPAPGASTPLPLKPTPSLAPNLQPR